MNDTMTTTDTEVTTITTIIDLINKVWQGDIILPKDTANKFMDNDKLVSEGIIVKDNYDGTILFTKKNIQSVQKEEEHKYIMPDFADRVRFLLKNAIDGKHSCNILLSGPAGTGKSQFVHEIAKEMGFAKVFHVNGIEEMGEDAFYGRLSCEIDPKTGNNYTPFLKGPLYRAFIEGTEVDDNGNQVLYDDNGNVTTNPNGKPKVIGKPAVFFLDEFATVRPEIFLGVFNRALEIPRNSGDSRSIEITAEGGKTIKSHPGMVMFFAGNVFGNGSASKYQFGYTAQTNQMDISTLNRMTARYQFGYNKVAEEAIVRGKLNDDLESDRLLKFKNDMRNMYRNDKISTLFSTRNIVSICDIAYSYRNSGDKNWMVHAIKDSIFIGLPDNERDAWNETIRMIWGVNLLEEESNSVSNYDYFN